MIVTYTRWRLISGLLLIGLLGCAEQKTDIRKHLESTGEMPRKETLDDVRVEDKTRIFCDACCARSMPGYKYCEGHLKRWVEGMNARND